MHSMLYTCDSFGIYAGYLCDFYKMTSVKV